MIWQMIVGGHFSLKLGILYSKRNQTLTLVTMDFLN
jgi:hypothetical protein